VKDVTSLYLLGVIMRISGLAIWNNLPIVIRIMIYEKWDKQLGTVVL